MKKIIVPIVITIVVAGGLGFYGGMTYGRSVSQASRRAGGFQQAAQQGGFGPSRQGGGITGGEIMSKDATSITVKLGSGGSKIVFVSSSTAVMKSAAGSLSDLVMGEQVVVSGSANSDGSITAQSVQIRPAPRGN